MMKTVLCHFYNEEYLLPWWLSHHRKIFDHGIMINYGSTDNSVKIIKQYCPTWTIVDSRNECFDTRLCDEEIMDYESLLRGARITLTVTEFLYGDYSQINQLDVPSKTRIVIPVTSIIDPIYNKFYDPEKLLIDSCMPWGISYKDDLMFRCARSIHNCPIAYPDGRHIWENISDMGLIIFWHGFSPWNETIVNRKLAIQTKMPSLTEVNKTRGHQHRVTRDELFAMHEKLVQKSSDIEEEISKYRELHYSYFREKDKGV